MATRPLATTGEHRHDASLPPGPQGCRLSGPGLRRSSHHELWRRQPGRRPDGHGPQDRHQDRHQDGTAERPRQHQRLGSGDLAAGSSGPQPCATSALKATIGPAEGAAGSSYYPIDFTSNASTSCTLFGYPGVSFVTGQGGGQIGAAAVRDSVTAPALVTVAPGAIAHATLQVVNASNYPASRCTITKAHWLRVYPPDQFTALYISFSAPTCAGSATATPILSIQAVKPGATGQ